MPRYKLTIEYDGNAFSGWQRQQEHVLTVQSVIEGAIAAFTQERVTLHVAGRTDRGVHALGQVAHFDMTRSDFTPHRIAEALNAQVRPHPVSVLNVEEVTEDFHARFSAAQRSYRYDILNRRAPPTFQKNHVWHVSRALDIELMQKAANTLLGHHDFSTFRAVNCQSNSAMRTLDLCEIRQQGEMVSLYVSARSFLYHQVRNMTGTLALVGYRQWSLEQFEAAFKAADRAKGGPTAPPQGLFFVSVKFQDA